MATCVSDRVEKQKELVESWFDDPLIKAATKGDGKFLKKMFYTITGEDFDYGALPSMRKLKKLDKHMKRFSNRLTKQTGPFAQYFYLPEEVLKNNPIAQEAFNGFKISHDYFRGNKEKYDKTLTDIAKSLQRIAQETAIAKEEGSPNIKKATKELDKRYRTYYDKLQGGDFDAAEKYWVDNIKKLAEETQFQVFEEADAVLRNRDLMRTNPEKYLKYRPVVRYWDSIKGKLFGDLKTGLDTYISSLKRVDNHERFGGVIASLERLRENLAPKKDYFPTDVLDVFPAVGKVQEALYQRDLDIKEAKEKGDTGTLEEYVSNAVDKVLTSLNVPGAVIPTESSYPRQRYSKNIIGVMDGYIRSVTRFNYQVNTTSHLTKAVQGLANMQNETQLTGTSKFLLDYLYDTHESMMGMNIKNKGARNFVRGITAWEFISKLGLNVRSAARNATQSLQNFVYFGAKGTYQAFQHIKQYELTNVVNKEMERHDIFFVETRELANSLGLFPDIEISTVDGKEVPTFKYDSMSSKFLNGLEKVAKVTGKPMQFVENKINRQLTFKIAFSKHHQGMMHNEGRIRSMIEKNKDSFQGEDLQKKIDKYMQMESGRFAANMVRELHYEYAPFAKPKVLRTGVGTALGQFMTYSVNFYNYNRRILRRGVEDVSIGDVWGQDAWRMYRLGSMYATINGVVSPMFNTDVGNLIQHDTFDRVSQYYNWVMGDEAAKKKAFYGKGPIIGTAGGPFVADLVTLGNVFGMYDLLRDAETGDRSAWGYLAGYQDYSARTKDEKAFEVVRTINTELGRFLYGTAPRAWNGASVGSLFALELGLFPSKEMKERKASYVTTAREDLGIPIPLPRYMQAKPKTKKEKKRVGDIMEALKGMQQVA